MLCYCFFFWMNLIMMSFQLARHNKELQAMLKPGGTYGEGDEALEFYAKHTAQIEVSRWGCGPLNCTLCRNFLWDTVCCAPTIWDLIDVLILKGGMWHMTHVILTGNIAYLVRMISTLGMLAQFLLCALLERVLNVYNVLNFNTSLCWLRLSTIFAK